MFSGCSYATTKGEYHDPLATTNWGGTMATCHIGLAGSVPPSWALFGIAYKIAIFRYEQQDECYAAVQKALDMKGRGVFTHEEYEFETHGRTILFRWSTGWFFGTVSKICGKADRRKGYNYEVAFPPERYSHLHCLEVGPKYQFAKTSSDGAWVLLG